MVFFLDVLPGFDAPPGFEVRPESVAAFRRLGKADDGVLVEVLALAVALGAVVVDDGEEAAGFGFLVTIERPVVSCKPARVNSGAWCMRARCTCITLSMCSFVVAVGWLVLWWSYSGV